MLSQVEVALKFPVMFNAEAGIKLFEPVTVDEILKTLKKFDRSKSPGPDGWTVEFFLHFFDIIGPDLTAMVEESRIQGRVCSSLNSTFIALIPKADKPLSFAEFRPISLCNLAYKIISKIIADRIKGGLSHGISVE